MNYHLNKNIFPYITLFILFLICCTISVTCNGTGDAGDSIAHFLYSKYAFNYPSFFFHHWAKPFFVLLSSPFAQFGFTGIKIFNSIVAVCTAYFTFLSAKKMKIKNSFLTIIFLFFAPLNFLTIFSGLTEPLFALVLILSIFLMLDKKVVWAVVLISFLPFVRSEGLIIIGVFFIYLLFKKRFRSIPLLAAGHVVYSFVGYFYYKDFFWVFTKIPYACLASKYGSGPLIHFINQMPYILGIPLYGLLVIGLIYIFIPDKYKLLLKEKMFSTEEMILVYGSFLAFFIAHSLFWWLGIFESMGLKRVFVGVMPVMILICLNGFNLFVNKKFVPSKLGNTLLISVIMGFVLIFPFTKGPAAINWSKDLFLGKDQMIAEDVSSFIKTNYKDLNTYKFYYMHPHLSLSLDIDPFDTMQHAEIKNIFTDKCIPQKSLIIWDNWFSVVEAGVRLEGMIQDKRLKLIRQFEVKDKTKNYTFVLFEKQ